jgi:hypothetical protein
MAHARPQSLARLAGRWCPRTAAAAAAAGIGVVAWLVGAAGAPSGAALASAAAAPQPLHLPATFVPNAGQVGKRDVAYVAKTGRLTAYFRPREVVLDLTAPRAGTRLAALRGDAPAPARAVVRVRFVGANPSPAIAALDPLPGRVNFLRGNDPRRWVTDLPAYAGLVYRDVYPGIDLSYRAERGGLKSEFRVAPGTDPGRIRLAYLGAEGVRLTDAGALVVATAAGDLTEAPPVVYQEEAGGGRTAVPGRYALGARGRVRFAVGAYDPTRVLVIDPSLAFSRYLGGSSDDEGHGVAFHSSGSIHVVGETSSTDFPKFSFVQSTYGGGISDAFVTRLNADGVLLSSTYLGGTGEDGAVGVAVDASANTYVVGATDSTDFPTQSPLQGSNGGGFDGFVAKLNPQGNALSYSTYLGGSANDNLLGVALDASDNAYVAGRTESSTDFPLASALQGTFGGGTRDAVVAKLNSTGSALVYSTYLGGSGTDIGRAIAVESGAAYVGGTTTSTDFPVANALQGTSGGGDDGFVAKINAAGSALDYSTYLGGSATDAVLGIAVDSSGNAYVTGDTSSSTTFPLVNALQSTYGGGLEDAVVVKIAAGGASLTYSTFLGGAARDQGNAIAVDGAGQVVVAGLTDTPTTFPTASPLQATNAGSFDAFITQVNAAGSALLFSTYFGGSNSDFAEGVAVNATGDQIVVVGQTESTNLPTAGNLDNTLGGGRDAFVLRIGMNPATSVPALSAGGTVMLAVLLVATMALAGRRRGAVVLLLALGGALLLCREAGAYTLVRKIAWADASGRPGEALFQGVVENGDLRGVVRIEGVDFRVRGTQQTDGTVSGTLSRRDGTAAGTFSAQVEDDALLRGSFNLSGAGGDWVTPTR